MWNLNNKAKTPTFNNPKTIRRLIFTDRLNTSYVIEDEPIEKSIIGYTPTYKDYIAQRLDPNIDSNSNVYGIAKKLQPLTSRINEMKASIDTANDGLNELRKKALAEFEARKQQQEQTQQTDGGSNVPNTDTTQTNS